MKIILNLQDDTNKVFVDYAVDCALKMARDKDVSDTCTFSIWDTKKNEPMYVLLGRRNKKSVSVTDQRNYL